MVFHRIIDDRLPGVNRGGVNPEGPNYGLPGGAYTGALTDPAPTERDGKIAHDRLHALERTARHAATVWAQAHVGR
jgi:hypothetical protein